MATTNPADYHRFDHLGWLAPGYQADVLCFDDLAELRAGAGLAGGQARRDGRPDRSRGRAVSAGTRLDVPFRAPGNPPGAEAFDLARPASGRARVIGVESRSLSTKRPRGRR